VLVGKPATVAALPETNCPVRILTDPAFNVIVYDPLTPVAGELYIDAAEQVNCAVILVLVVTLVPVMPVIVDPTNIVPELILLTVNVVVEIEPVNLAAFGAVSNPLIA
jgi:hypothetical protein